MGIDESGSTSLGRKAFRLLKEMIRTRPAQSQPRLLKTRQEAKQMASQQQLHKGLTNTRTR
eukprot:319112-Pelagomonas_calceolata.AAC.1